MSIRAVSRSGSHSIPTLCLFLQRQLGLRVRASKFAPQQRRELLSGNRVLSRQLGVSDSYSARSQDLLRRCSTAQHSSSEDRQTRRQLCMATAVAAPASDQQQQEQQQHDSQGGAATSYEQQLAAKVAHVRQLFEDFDMPELEIFRSSPDHYRMRAEFRVWHEGAETYYIMYEKGEGGKLQQVRVDEFPRGSMLMNELRDLLMQKVKEVPTLRKKLYQANFHTTLSGQAMVTLVYHRPVDAEWEAAAKGLRTFLAQAPSCSQSEVAVIGRSKKRKLELDCSYVTEQLLVNGRTYTFRQVEGAFSQPNGSMCQHMLSWGQRVTAGNNDTDLLELYCGNANFTVPLAQNFRRVVATEVSKASVETAKHNLKVNDVDNVLVARMSSEEFTSAWREKRQATRLQGLDWSTLNLQTIFVDPPRAGLDGETVQLLKEFDNVVYVSCNPNTLVENLRHIKDSHAISQFAIFDQFPGTEHLECGAYLRRKAPASGSIPGTEEGEGAGTE